MFRSPPSLLPKTKPSRRTISPISVSAPKWTVGALGILTTIQTHVWDEEEHRLVQLTILDRQGKQRLLDTFVAAFEDADDWEDVSCLAIW